MSDNYYRFLSKKKALEAIPEESEKLSARDAFGIVMIAHGEEFGEDSAFGMPTPLSNFFIHGDGAPVLTGNLVDRNLPCQIRSGDVQARCATGDASFDIQRHVLWVAQDVP